MVLPGGTMAEEDASSLVDFWSAAGGAALAFLIESLRRFRDRGREEQDAANRALLSLAAMYSELTVIWNQIYVAAQTRIRELNRRDPVAMEILPMQLPPEPSTSLDMGSLAFLLRTHEPNMVTQLALVEIRYISDLAIERERARMHLEAQAKLNASGLREGHSYSNEDADNIVGQAAMRQLQSLTTAQQSHIPRTLESIRQARDDLSSVASLHLPTRMIVTFSDVVPGEKQEQKAKATPWRYAVRGLMRTLRKSLRALKVA
jgi:hypothetical protein